MYNKLQLAIFMYRKLLACGWIRVCASFWSNPLKNKTRPDEAHRKFPGLVWARDGPGRLDAHTDQPLHCIDDQQPVRAGL
jgi:hypothetical protein